MPALILTYHSINIGGNDYCNNDHVALASDLPMLSDLGWTVVPLTTMVEALRQRRLDAANKWVALTFDDGSWFDWYDLDHPSHGPQPGMATILRQFALSAAGRSQPTLQATAFVIASPQARAELDRSCLVGRGWWSDEWWPLAQREGLLRIQNHSWDHNHSTLSATAVAGEKGKFSVLSTYEQADAEIRQAADYLDGLCGSGTSSVFSYPYGESSEYLRREYFPRHLAEHRLAAAVTTEPQRLSNDTDPWLIPRFVCGWHWQSADELRQILLA